MAAKFELERSSDGQFYFNLKAANGEVAVTSELYVGKSGATRGIEAVKQNAPEPQRFARLQSKSGEPYFVLKAANHEPIGTSEMYSSKAARDSGIEAVQRSASQATTLDLT